MGIPAELEARKVSSPIVSSEDLILDRAKGAVCGGAAGDALGAGYEFRFSEDTMEQCAEEQQAML